LDLKLTSEYPVKY